MVPQRGRGRQSTASPTPKSGSASWPDVTTLAQEHDCLLLDLDGTVFRGHEPTEGAVAALADAGIRKLFVTNNASRSADEVAAHLCELGFAAGADDVVTSAQSAARLLAQQLPAGSTVLIVGTEVAGRRDRGGRAAAGPRSSRTSPSRSCRGIRPQPDGRIWPRRRWRSARVHSGWPPTSTRRCPRNAGCCPVTGRWSPRCAPRPTRAAGGG